MSEERELRIRDRAFAIWEAQGRPEGRDLDIWLTAEMELDASAEPAITSAIAAPESVYSHSAN